MFGYVLWNLTYYGGTYIIKYTNTFTNLLIEKSVNFVYNYYNTNNANNANANNANANDSNNINRIEYNVNLNNLNKRIEFLEKQIEKYNN
jgi:hypothetical protein